MWSEKPPASVPTSTVSFLKRHLLLSIDVDPAGSWSGGLRSGGSGYVQTDVGGPRLQRKVEEHG